MCHSLARCASLGTDNGFILLLWLGCWEMCRCRYSSPAVPHPNPPLALPPQLGPALHLSSVAAGTAGPRRLLLAPPTGQAPTSHFEDRCSEVKLVTPHTLSKPSTPSPWLLLLAEFVGVYEANANVSGPTVESVNF